MPWNACFLSLKLHFFWWCCSDFLKAKLGSGRLMGPKGVSVDQNGHVIVVDNKACTVFIFQPSGKLVTKFGSRGNGDRQFAGRYISTAVKTNTWWRVADCIVTCRCKFYIWLNYSMSSCNHSMVLYEFNLALYFHVGPHFAAVNNNNEIIITDFHNHSVKVSLACCFLTLLTL